MKGTFGLKEKLQASPAGHRKTGLQFTFKLSGQPGQRFEMRLLPFGFVQNARALVAASARGRIMPAAECLAGSAAVSWAGSGLAVLPMADS